MLHGEKDQKDRKLAIDRLKAGGVKILVATDVAARGLDVDGRIGRVGKVGAPDSAATELLLSPVSEMMPR